MKIFEQISNLFRQTDENLASAMSDPVRDGKFAIEDSQKEIDGFMSQIHDLIANTEDLKKQRDNAQLDVDKYTRIATQAAAAGNRDDVAAAVTEKQRAATLLASLQAAIAKNQDLEDKLRQQVAEARNKVANAQINQARLAANIGSSQLREKLAKSSVQFSGQSKGLAALDKLQQAADHAESSATAWETLAAETPEGRSKSLEEKYGSATNPSVDGEVEQLMLQAQQSKQSALPAPQK